MLGVVITFIVTFFVLSFPLPFLPVDQGRAFAVNGKLSKGKVRGIGLCLVLCFVVGSAIFVPLDREYVIYLILLTCSMISGYLDDASKAPWSDYKKGLIDLMISVMTMITYVNFNDTAVYVGEYVLTLPKAVYFILGILLLWISINVTNCTDGVDGLCATLCIVTLMSFSAILGEALGKYAAANYILIAVLLAYLYFNTSPSSMLMGDAGSRALGFYIAVIAMKSRQPFMFLPLALVLILDGGLGLVKIFLKRFLKISIFKNIRLPLHVQARKAHGWSDTQVVVRFTMAQILVSILTYVILTGE